MSRPVTYLSMTSVGISSVASTDDDILIPVFADEESLPRDTPLSFYFSASSICPSMGDPDICLSPIDSSTFRGPPATSSQCSVSGYNGDYTGVHEEIGVQRQQLQQVGEEDECEVEVDDDVDAETIADGQAAGLRHTVALESTAAYHESLLDQHRHLTTPEPEAPRSTSSRDTSHNGNGFLLSALYWIQLPKAKVVSKATETRGAAGTSNAARPPRFYHDSQGTPANVSREDLEEFVSLPGAIQRKFFSTSERLRFESSGHLQQYKENPDFDLDLDLDLTRNNSFSTTLSQPRGDLSTPSHWRQPVIEPPATTFTQEQASPECFVLAKQLPSTYREEHLTREQQVLLAKALRESVILDTARDLQAKFQLVGSRTDQDSRPGSNNSGQDTGPVSTRSSMDSATRRADAAKHSVKLNDPQEALADSFRWLDEDEDLDLRLVLDNYPRTYKGQQPLPKKDSRTSFHRHLSLTRMSFNRSSSLYTTQPPTQDSASSPTATSPTLSMSARESKRKSRALSLITPKHAPHTSVSSIDPDAAHYQDPATRSKVRDFLASPQKFDEAIEYGFPSQEDNATDLNKSDRQQVKGHTRQNLSEDSERFKTFFADDQSSTYSEDISMADSESPRTPHTPDQSPSKSSPISSHSDDRAHKVPGQFTQQGQAASREMTLRMTLTRPDLRACETDIYGWQRGSSRQSGRVSQASNARFDSPPPPTHKYASKDSFDKVFADIDQEVSETQQDRGVMKRMWKKVRKV